MADAIEPFRLAVPQSELDDLHTCLTRIRWPDAETVTDTSQGAAARENPSAHQPLARPL